MPHNKDSLGNTFLVATLLCLACATLVSSAAVVLKPLQSANALNDRRANILKVSGFSDDEIEAAGGVNPLFEQRFETTIIDLSTGEIAVEECAQALELAGKQLEDVVNGYDQVWCSKSKKLEVAEKLTKKQDIVGIKFREKYSHIFLLRSDDGKIEKYVFPVRGYGLWSMMQGYLAVEPDLATVAGLTFYEQGETPGLGGEVMNPRWKKKWHGKMIYQDGEVALKVSKGDQSSNDYGVDALSGATITSNGVSKLVKFWMGAEGFGTFISKQPKSTATNATGSENQNASLNFHSQPSAKNSSPLDTNASAALGVNHG